MQGRKSHLLWQLPQTLAVLAEAPQSERTLLYPPLVYLGPSAATERVTASQSLCAGSGSDMRKDVFPLPGGGRVGSVDSSLAQLAVPEGRDSTPPPIPFHPLHGAYLTLKPIFVGGDNYLKCKLKYKIKTIPYDD